MAVLAKQLEKAIKLYQKGDLVRARSLCLKVLKKSKEITPPYFILGCIARDQKQFNKAISYFNQAIEINPSEFGCYLNLGAVYQELGQLQNATNAFFKATELNPDMAEAHLGLGIVRNKLGDNTLAEESLRRAIKLSPSLLDAQHSLGVLLCQENRSAESIEILKTVISVNPQYQKAYRNLGKAYLQLGMKDKALQALSDYIELQGPDESTQHMIDALNGNHVTGTPDLYVQNLFDDFSGTFEHHLVHELKYDIPAEMRALLITQNVLGNNTRVLDLGCGTGLIGQQLGKQIEFIDGVDLSQCMLNKAREKSLYRNLFNANIIEFINVLNSKETYNLVIAADVLVYLGALEPLFEALKNNISFGAETHFLFSLETIENNAYKLLPSGRYAHNIRYVEELCQLYAFDIVTIKKQLFVKNKVRI